jgi:arylsulfatase A-like enzyme
MREAQPRSRLEGLLTALAGSQVLLVASFAKWAYQSKAESVIGANFRQMHRGPILGSALGDALVGFAAAQLLMHAVFGVACWWLARCSRRAWPQYPATTRTWVVLWLVFGVLWILIANAALYPRSVLGDHLADLAQLQWAGISVFHAASALMAAAVLVPFVVLAKRRFDASDRQRNSVPWLVTTAVLLAVSGMGVATYSGDPRSATPRQPARPNVILIGLDSVRCDATGILGNSGLTPNVDAFLSQSSLMTDALTPLARTYPSWVSILTGKHPHSTGAIVNLIHKDQLHLGDTLPLALRRAGYRTAYAIDEVRFSNIDASYGFDQTIMPPIGAADFVIGELNDAPLSNLLANTRIGQWLVPYGYANRAAAIIYDPDSFVARLDRELDFREPTFLAVHLTLAHWPYAWADSRQTELTAKDNWTSAHYRPAVRRVDQQFGQVLEVLRRKGALDNAIVVVLSDHGEAVGLPGDSPWAHTGPADDPYERAILSGHGTSVLSPQQYRVLFSIRGFGPASHGIGAPRRIAAPATLEDVTPTINEWLGLGMPAKFDGRSLLSLLRGAPAWPAAMEDRIRFTETEFNPRGFMPHEKQTPSIIANAMSSYEIDRDTGRMYIQRRKHDLLLRQRQYAALRGSEILAAIPGTYSSDLRFLYIDQSRKSYPVRLDGPPDASLGPNAAALWTALHQRFGGAFARRDASPARAAN